MPDPGSPANVVGRDGALPARPGYDHDWFAWSPLPERPPVSWPGGASTAVSVVIRLGAVEWESHDQAPPLPPGGRGLGDPPDFPRMSHREFGHRVGVFRLLRVLDSLDIPPAVVVDVLTAEHYRPLVHHLLPVAAEILAGGMSASRPVTSRMSEDEERDYVHSALDRLERALGVRPAGWLGPEHSESARTPAVLAAANMDYVADWANDELPYSITGAGRDLWAFPLSWELSDVAAGFQRQVSPDTWADSVITAFDVLHSEGGRMLSLDLQPWISGQAYRTASLERALGHLREQKDVWFAPPGEIVEHCRAATAGHEPRVSR